VERSKFDHCTLQPIAIFNSSNADIFSCSILNSNNKAIYVYSDSKLRIHGSVFENCQNGIYSNSKSDTQFFNHSFRQMSKYSIYCIGAAMISCSDFKIIDPKRAFFHSTNEGFIKMFSSKNKTVQ
jgi:nitrous oxidase accessory protein NosD